MRPKIKVLQVPKWVKLSVHFETKNDPDSTFQPESEIPSLFNRDGYYLMMDRCWIEYQGKSYIYEKEKFNTDMVFENMKHNRIRDVEYQLLLQLRTHKMLSNENRNALDIETHCRRTRATKIEIRKVKKSALGHF